MICKRCKQEIPDDAAICKYCGEIIEENMEKKVKEKEQEIQKMEEEEKEDLSIEELLREPLPTEFKVTDKLPYKQSKQYLERKKQVKKTIAMTAGMIAATVAFGVGTFFLVRNVILRPDEPTSVTRIEPETNDESDIEETVNTATPSVSAVTIKKERETEETESETESETETESESESVRSVSIQVSGNRRTETEEVAPVTIRRERQETETESLQTDPGQTDPGQTNPGQTDPGQTNPGQTEPPQTEPPQTEPPQTEPPQTEPPQTEPPQTESETDPYQEGWGEEEEPIYSGGGYILPNSSSELLTRDSLVGMSASDLMLARNEIFARHGRMFEDEWLQSYFNSQSWYQPLYSPSEFSYDLLSSIEVQNVETILAYEAELAAES